MVFVNPSSYDSIIALCNEYETLLKTAKEKEQVDSLKAAETLNNILDIPEQFAGRFNLQFQQFTKYTGADIYCVLSHEEYEKTAERNTFDLIHYFNSNPLSNNRQKTEETSWVLLKFKKSITYPYLIITIDPLVAEREQELRHLILATLETFLPSSESNQPVSFDDFYKVFNEVDHKINLAYNFVKNKSIRILKTDNGEKEIKYFGELEPKIDDYINGLNELEIPDMEYDWPPKLDIRDSDAARRAYVEASTNGKDQLVRITKILLDYNKKLKKEPENKESVFQVLQSIFTVINPYFAELNSKGKIDPMKQRNLLENIKNIVGRKFTDTGLSGKRTTKLKPVDKSKLIFNSIKDYTDYSTNVEAKEIADYIIADGKELTPESFKEFLLNNYAPDVRVLSRKLKNTITEKGMGAIEDIFEKIQEERYATGELSGVMNRFENSSFFKKTVMSFPSMVYYDVENLADQEKYIGNFALLANAIKEKMRPPSSSTRQSGGPREHEGVHPFMGQIDLTNFEGIRKSFPNDVSRPPDINYVDYFGDNEEAIEKFRAANSLNPSDRHKEQKRVIDATIDKMISPELFEEAAYLDSLWGKISNNEAVDYSKEVDKDLVAKLMQAEKDSKVETKAAKPEEAAEFVASEALRTRTKRLAIVNNEIQKITSLNHVYKLLELQEIIKPDSAFFWANKMYSYINKAQKIMSLKFVLDSSTVLNPFRMERLTPAGASNMVGKDVITYPNGGYFLKQEQFDKIKEQVDEITKAVKAGIDDSFNKGILISYFAFIYLYNAIAGTKVNNEILQQLKNLPPNLQVDNEINDKIRDFRLMKSKKELKDSFVQVEGGYVLSPKIYDSIFMLLSDHDYDSSLNISIKSMMDNDDDPNWRIYSELMKNYKELYDDLEFSGFVFNMQKNDPMVQEFSDVQDSGKSRMIDPIYMKTPGGGEGIVRKPYESVTGFPSRDRAFPTVLEYAMNEDGTYILDDNGNRIGGIPKNILLNPDLLMIYLSFNNEMQEDINKAVKEAQSFGEVVDPKTLVDMLDELAHAAEDEKLNITGNKAPAISFTDVSGGISVEEYQGNKQGKAKLTEEDRLNLKIISDKIDKIKNRYIYNQLIKIFDAKTVKDFKKLSPNEFIEIVKEAVEGKKEEIPANVYKSITKDLQKMESFLIERKEIKSEKSDIKTIDVKEIKLNIKTILPMKITEYIHRYFLRNSILYKSAIAGSQQMDEYAKNKILAFINTYVKDNKTIFNKSIEELLASQPEAREIGTSFGWTTSTAPYLSAFRSNFPKFTEATKEYISEIKRRELSAEDKKRMILMYLFEIIDESDDPMDFADDFVRSIIINGAIEAYQLDELIKTKIENKLGTFNQNDVKAEAKTLTLEFINELDFSAKRNDGFYSNILKSLPKLKSLLLSDRGFEVDKLIYDRTYFYLEDTKRINMSQEVTFDEKNNRLDIDAKDTFTESVAPFTFELLRDDLNKVDIKKNDAMGLIKRVERERRFGRQLPGDLEAMVSTITSQMYELDQKIFEAFQKESSEIVPEQYSLKKILPQLVDDVAKNVKPSMPHLGRIIENAKKNPDNFMDKYFRIRIKEISDIAQRNNFDGIHRFNATPAVFNAIFELVPQTGFIHAGFSIPNIRSIIKTNIENNLFKDNSRKKGIYPIKGREFEDKLKENFKEMDELFKPKINENVEKIVKYFHNFEEKLGKLIHSVNAKNKSQTGDQFVDLGEVVPETRDEFRDKIIGASDEDPNKSNIYKSIRPIVSYLVKDLTSQLRNTKLNNITRSKINSAIEQKTELVANYAYDFLDYLLNNLEIYPARTVFKFDSKYKERTEFILKYMNMLYGSNEEEGEAALKESGFSQSALAKLIKNTIDAFSNYQGMGEQDVEVLNIRSDVAIEKSTDIEKSLQLKFDGSPRIGLDVEGNKSIKIPNAYGNGDEFIIIQRMPLSRLVMRQIDFIKTYNLKNADDVRKFDAKSIGASDALRKDILLKYNNVGIERLAQLADVARQTNMYKLSKKNYYVKLKLVEKGKIQYQPKTHSPSVKDNNNIGESIDKMGGQGSTLKNMMNAIIAYDDYGQPVSSFLDKKNDTIKNIINFSGMFGRNSNNNRKYYARDAILSEENLDKLNAICAEAVRSDVLDMDPDFAESVLDADAADIFGETLEKRQEEKIDPAAEKAKEKLEKELEKEQEKRDKREVKDKKKIMDHPDTISLENMTNIKDVAPLINDPVMPNVEQLTVDVNKKFEQGGGIGDINFNDIEGLDLEGFKRSKKDLEEEADDDDDDDDNDFASHFDEDEDEDEDE